MSAKSGCPEGSVGWYVASHAAGPEVRSAGRPSEPLYRRAVREISAQIRRGDLVPGDPLPSERSLCATYRCSSITARRVLAELRAAGLAERRAGLGSRVSSSALRQRIALLVLEYREPARRIVGSAFGELIGGIAEAAWEAGARLTIAYLDSREECARWLGAVSHQTDGILVRVAGDIEAADLDLLDAAGPPYVVLKRHLPGRHFGAVTADERQAAALVARHLLDLGHARVGFVCALSGTVLWNERLAGYRLALQERGIPFDPALVCAGPDFGPEAGEACARELLDSPRRPTALLVASDSMAMGAYRSAARLGLAIPAQLSIGSIDHIPEAGSLDPPLTTVRPSHHEFGIRATRLVMDEVQRIWAGLTPTRREEVIAPTLSVRASTAPPPA